MDFNIWGCLFVVSYNHSPVRFELFYDIRANINLIPLFSRDSRYKLPRQNVMYQGDKLELMEYNTGVFIT